MAGDSHHGFVIMTLRVRIPRSTIGDFRAVAFGAMRGAILAGLAVILFLLGLVLIGRLH
jgi:hypothetical protein